MCGVYIIIEELLKGNDKLYILGINGSPNDNGDTAFLINLILDECKKMGADIEIANAGKAVMSAKTPFCVACSNPCSKICYKGTALEELFEKMKKADAIVFGSPVYFGTASAQLKALFDKSRALRGEKVFIGKPCGFVSVGASRFGGQETTLKHMQSMALVQGMTVVGSGHSDYDAGHHGVAAQRPAKEDDFAKSRCKSMAKRLLEEIKK